MKMFRTPGATRGRAMRTWLAAAAALCLSAPALAAHAVKPDAEPQLVRVASLPASSQPAGVPGNYVVTPNGYFDPSCVRTLHAGETLRKDGRIRGANGALQAANVCTRAHFTLNGVRVMPNGLRYLGSASADNASGTEPEQSGWVMSANYSSNSPIGRIVATWTVPAAPSAQQDAVIYFFPGLEQLPNVQSILQPVLGWNSYGGKAWTLASWNCCVSGTTYHSAPVAAHTGDVVVGDTYSTCAAGVDCSTWKIDSRDTTTGQTSSLTTNPYADLNWVYGGVLEVYNVSTCSEYPASSPIVFHNIQVYRRDGSRVASPPWNSSADTSGINPQCNYNLSSMPSSVTLSY
ncbi:hypothetical protein [Oleiagrimonas sp. C23AA]|uniref:hypothetical protein n=1 Tax=Oleiagrimonas sp. C23AA TaxID=2719047 RepID=UPI001980073E|nr:hypothetical protein [Oleiagrimonas sp. C23AA]